MSRTRRLALVAVAVMTSGQANAQEQFQHRPHERLFPTCESCHQLQPQGVTFPPPALCGGCHNGQLVRTVDWRGPNPPPSNLAFEHTRVIAAKRQALNMDVECSLCHQRSDETRTGMSRGVVSTCLACHAPGQEHQVGAPCLLCHVPITEAGDFTADEIRAFPVPGDHSETWVLEHGALASENVTRCSVCHARDFCASCHVNAQSLTTIQALQPDPRVAEIAAGREAVYPLPASHQSTDWLGEHRDAAGGDGAACATCHASPSCRSCHVEPVPEAVRRLPGESQSSAQARLQRAPGVQLARRPPYTHTPTFFDDHRAVAAAATGQCSVCHVQTDCESCHTGSQALTRPGQDVSRYHPANFQQRHSAPGFGSEVECATCHNPEAFCRDCHLSRGTGSTGRIDTGFHSNKATWVFGHGQAARQSLETCASCHSERHCLECHSGLRGRRVNPHGPDFDPERLRSRNPETCVRCHPLSILNP